MKRISILIEVKFILLFLLALNPNANAQDMEIKSDNDKTFYTVGTWLGAKLVNLRPTERELNAVIQGFRDTAEKKKAAIDVSKYHRKVQKVFESRLAEGAKGNKKKGAAFLKKFVSDGGKKTKSGLAYKIITPGKGKTPKPTDQVEVHYHGTLIDGTVFDSSLERGKKVTFHLNKVIKGWQEGLQLIKPGGKIKLLVPSTLAYGDRGLPPKIPGGATLVFEVELFSMKKASASATEKPNNKGKKNPSKDGDTILLMPF